MKLAPHLVESDKNLGRSNNDYITSECNKDTRIPWNKKYTIYTIQVN